MIYLFSAFGHSQNNHVAFFSINYHLIREMILKSLILRAKKASIAFIPLSSLPIIHDPKGTLAHQLQKF